MMERDNQPTTASKKHKRGKYKHMLIEDDDDAIDIVTFKELKADKAGV